MSVKTKCQWIPLYRIVYIFFPFRSWLRVCVYWHSLRSIKHISGGTSEFHLRIKLAQLHQRTQLSDLTTQFDQWINDTTFDWNIHAGVRVRGCASLTIAYVRLDSLFLAIDFFFAVSSHWLGDIAKIHQRNWAYAVLSRVKATGCASFIIYKRDANIFCTSEAISFRLVKYANIISSINKIVLIGNWRQWFKKKKNTSITYWVWAVTFYCNTLKCDK